ncbi:hypothetical protein D9M69_04630 [compost metagenome]
MFKDMTRQMNIQQVADIAIILPAKTEILKTVPKRNEPDRLEPRVDITSSPASYQAFEIRNRTFKSEFEIDVRWVLFEDGLGTKH